MDGEFINKQLNAVEILDEVKKGEELSKESEFELSKIVGEKYRDLIKYFTPIEEPDEAELDDSQPSIILTSFVGCKGLSAGHVFIVAANNGVIPKDPESISNIEISQFIVALTRTRKQCQIISNIWLIAPKLKGEWQQRFQPSTFISWIPDELVDNRGSFASKDL